MICSEERQRSKCHAPQLSCCMPRFFEVRDLSQSTLELLYCHSIGQCSKERSCNSTQSAVVVEEGSLSHDAVLREVYKPTLASFKAPTT